jgi:hypothetical protein
LPTHHHDVLSPVEVPAFPAAVPGLTVEQDPGLALRSLVFNKLSKKSYSTSCCICSVGLSMPPPMRLPPLLPPPSISASARSTAGSERVDEPSGLTRSAVPRGPQDCRKRSARAGSRRSRQVSREWERACLGTLVLLHCFHAPASLPPSSTPDSDETSYSHALPHAFVSKPSRMTAIFSQLSHQGSRSSVSGL